MSKKHSEVLNVLYEGYKILNFQITFLNIGGCGFFAEHLYKLLVKLGFKPKLLALTPTPEALTIAIDLESVCFDAYIVHIVVKLGKYYVDSTGFYAYKKDLASCHNYQEFETKCCNLPIETLEKWNGTEDFWDKKFDHKYIDVIKEKLDECYNQVAA